MALRRSMAIGAVALALGTGPAAAADLLEPPPPELATAFDAAQTRFFLHTGPLVLINAESAKIKVGGAPFAGASISLEAEYSAGFEIGYHFTPNIAVAFAGGFPPKAAIDGTGNAAPLGRLGNVLYGPIALTMQYHFREFGRLQPYVGAGPVFLAVLDNNDSSIENLKVDAAFGAAIQVGANFMFNDNWGVYVDVKKAYLRTKAKGNVRALGGAPMTADVTLDPLVVGAGITYRF